MRSTCPLARSNGGASSSTAAFMAVVIMASISAACAEPVVTINAAAATIARAPMSFLLPCGIESLCLVDRCRGRRGQCLDQRLRRFGFVGARRHAGRIERDELQLRRQHTDHLDLG